MPFLVNKYLFGVVRDFPVRRDEENVFWLQICVGEFALVQELDRVTHLIGDMSDLVQRVRVIVVFFLQ